MAEIRSFDAALLAGGRSRRFGSDKAFLKWRGEPLFERQLALLQRLEPAAVWISANEDQDFPVREGVTVLVDDELDEGPLGGMLTVFRQSAADWILVLGVDLPLMEGGFLQGLITGRKGVVPKTDRFWEPLAAIYPRVEMLALLERAFSEGDRKLQHLLDQAEAGGLVEALPVSLSDKLLFTNLNSTTDLREIDPNRTDDMVQIRRYRDGSFRTESDFVAAEEPLEIRVNDRSVAVMMRTPGCDEELVTGFLFTESMIQSAAEIISIEHSSDLDRESVGNTINVCLAGEPDLKDLTRHVFTSSSCGVCGKATIDSVFQQFPPLSSALKIDPEVILSLPGTLRSAQKTFEKTGGLHASALFSREGELLILREDVGRHNALDKVIGHGLREDVPFREVILLVSGRISFELTQKALAAGISMIAGISAPTSLAVDLAAKSGQTLIGFLRERGFNVYSGES
ncbi:MAG: formate dehydrogenase accessory sulfurtransferase FdhD [Verrucomicrobiales bacterium]|nr:formate dehydrogenase accessory sulfurtransferase FdhD [Verrucomicrobiales bacterium]